MSLQVQILEDGFLTVRGLLLFAGQPWFLVFRDVLDVIAEVLQCFFCVQTGAQHVGKGGAWTGMMLRCAPWRRIFEIPQKNVQHIKQAQGLIDQFPGWVLRMRGLPYSATPDDVVRLENPLPVARPYL